MRLQRILFATRDAQGMPKASETIDGNPYLRFFDFDLDAMGQARCHRIVPQSALSREDWAKAMRFRPIDVAALVSYGPYTAAELAIERKHVEDIRNAERHDIP